MGAGERRRFLHCGCASGRKDRCGTVAGGDEAGEGAVVEQKNGEKEDEVVEKGIVGGEDDADLPGGDEEEAGDTPGPGTKGHEDEDELHEQGQGGGADVEPVGEVPEVPADPGGKRSILVVVVHGGEVAPGGIAGEELDDAQIGSRCGTTPRGGGGSWRGRGGSRRRGRVGGRRGRRRGRGSRLEQHAIGLVAGEVLGGGDKGEEAQKAEQERGARPEVEDDEGGGEEAGPAEDGEGGIGGGDPKERGGVPEAGEGAEALADCVEVAAGGEEAVGPDEAVDLEEEREECGEVDEAEAAKKEPAGEVVVGKAVRGGEEAAEGSGGGHGPMGFGCGVDLRRLGVRVRISLYQWSAVSGQWSVVSGQWSVSDRGRRGPVSNLRWIRNLEGGGRIAGTTCMGWGGDEAFAAVGVCRGAAAAVAGGGRAASGGVAARAVGGGGGHGAAAAARAAGAVRGGVGVSGDVGGLAWRCWWRCRWGWRSGGTGGRGWR